MKLFKPTTSVIITALMDIFLHEKYADKVVNNALKQNTKFGSRDRRFVAESIYEIVRWWRLLTTLAKVQQPKKEEDFWKIVGVYLLRSGIELPNWEEFNNVTYNPESENNLELKIKESIPDWLDELGKNELGEDWKKEIQALNYQAKVVLRVNTLKITKQKLIELLAQKEIYVSEIKGIEDALILEERKNIQSIPEFKDGLFEIQDASSQLIVDFLDLKKGTSVIDACAGAGGKSLHIAARMQNIGNITALDVEKYKLVELQHRAKRAGISMIKTKTIENLQALASFKNSADRLLLDVPCSGLGVLKRNPGAKWKLSYDFIQKIKKNQQEIIQNYSVMLKNEGIMVYATCSILPSENRKQVDLFLKNNPNFELIKDQSTLPSDGFDGFYMAALQKKST